MADGQRGEGRNPDEHRHPTQSTAGFGKHFKTLAIIVIAVIVLAVVFYLWSRQPAELSLRAPEALPAAERPAVSGSPAREEAMPG